MNATHVPLLHLHIGSVTIPWEEVYPSTSSANNVSASAEAETCTYKPLFGLHHNQKVGEHRHYKTSSVATADLKNKKLMLSLLLKPQNHYVYECN